MKTRTYFNYKTTLQSFFLIILINFFCPTLYADTPGITLDSLLSSPTRPTVQQVLDLNAKSRETAPKENNGLIQHAILETIPKAMALLEYAYPGATFAPLGRDAVIMGDALEAAYLKLGQKGRILRVDLSGKSFDGPSTNPFGIPDAVLGYLMQIGLDPTRLIKENKTIIFGDRTNYKSRSQSRNIIRALYAKFASEGGDPKLLFNRLNFLSLSREDYFTASKTEVDQYKRIQHKDYPESIMTFPGITDSAAWHLSWKSPALAADGTYSSVPGEPTNQRADVIADLQTVIRITETREFWGRVAKEFKALGLPFHLKNLEMVKFRKTTNDLTLQEIEALFSEFEARLSETITQLINKDSTQAERLHYFIMDYGARMQGNLFEIRSSRPDLLKRYHTQMLPQIFQRLLEATTQTPAEYAEFRPALIAVITLSFAPSLPQTPELKRALLEVSKIPEIFDIFKDTTFFEGMVSSFNENDTLKLHRLFDGRQRLSNVRRISETLQRISRVRGSR